MFTQVSVNKVKLLEQIENEKIPSTPFSQSFYKRGEFYPRVFDTTYS